MSAPQTLQVVILDKDYQVSCPPEEREALLRSADELDQRMRRIRATGGVIGLERIAIMAALNLTYELLQSRRNLDQSSQTDRLLEQLNSRLDAALETLEEPVNATVATPAPDSSASL